MNILLISATVFLAGGNDQEAICYSNDASRLCFYAVGDFVEARLEDNVTQTLNISASVNVIEITTSAGSAYLNVAPGVEFFFQRNCDELSNQQQYESVYYSIYDILHNCRASLDGGGVISNALINNNILYSVQYHIFEDSYIIDSISISRNGVLTPLAPEQDQRILRLAVGNDNFNGHLPVEWIF
ncbi:hypothetical protein [Hyphobacterium indicum]|uniref:hypothetical protein n=1 Tax=Hyphobacterium indicum TaxID=2162714 RepID=UPI000F63E68D|nr:hypothetical protein [Hyphobacterium indicum]